MSWRAVSYSRLGVLAEGEDVVQEAWLRLIRTERSAIRGLRVLLVETQDWPTIVSFTVDQGHITEIDFIGNPEKLGTLAPPTRECHARGRCLVNWRQRKPD